MQLARFSHQGRIATGVVVGDEIVDLAAAAPDLPDTPVAAWGAGVTTHEGLRAHLRNGRHRLGLDDVELLAPIVTPSKFFAVGLNYADHIAESGLDQPLYPDVFTKMPSCLNGPYGEIELPAVSDQLDYEGELGFVIGRRCRHVPRDRAAEVIAGYVVVNDVTVRDWQKRTGQWTLGKSFDTHGPVGPWLITADELEDPHNLELRTWVNGEERQHSNTRHLIHDCFDLVATLSTACTLLPGDIVTTGTPAGVGLLREPSGLLAAGDVVRVEIEGIGAIENTVVAEVPQPMMDTEELGDVLGSGAR